MSRFAKQETVVKIRGRRYGKGKAREAAEEYASAVAAQYSFGFGKMKGVPSPVQPRQFRDFNDRHCVLYRRALPIFEKLLGPVKDRRNPRQPIEIEVDDRGFGNIVMPSGQTIAEVSQEITKLINRLTKE